MLQTWCHHLALPTGSWGGGNGIGRRWEEKAERSASASAGPPQIQLAWQDHPLAIDAASKSSRHGCVSGKTPCFSTRSSLCSANGEELQPREPLWLGCGLAGTPGLGDRLPHGAGEDSFTK